MNPDLTYGKGTGKPPALGINRGVSFIQRKRFLEYPHPSTKVKSFVEVSPSPRVSLSDTGDQARVILISNTQEGKKKKHRNPLLNTMFW